MGNGLIIILLSLLRDCVSTSVKETCTACAQGQPRASRVYLGGKSMAVKEKSDLSKKNAHFPRFLTQVLGTGAFALF